MAAEPEKSTTHVVQAGETILSITHDYGFRTWETIWDHPSNAVLKQKRPDPTILAPGDQVFVPAKEQKQESALTERRNVYRVRSLKAHIKYVVRFESGRRLTNALYRLVIDGKHMFEGRTDDEGVIDVEIQPNARRGELTVWYDEDDPEARLTWAIDIGGMTPIDTIAGAQSRLNHLGFDAGPVTGEMNEPTRAAVRAFQEFTGVSEPTGELDAGTRAALEKLQNAR